MRALLVVLALLAAAAAALFLGRGSIETSTVERASTDRPTDEAGPAATLTGPGVDTTDERRAVEVTDDPTGATSIAAEPEVEATGAPSVSITIVEAADGAPVPGLRVAFYFGRERKPTAALVTDDDGKVATPPLRLGRYRLQTVDRDVGWIDPGRVELVEDSGGTEQVMRLHRPTHRFTVEVVDASGSPAGNAVVQFPHRILDEDDGSPMSTGATARTNGEGRAEIVLFAPGGFGGGELFATRSALEVSRVLQVTELLEGSVPRLALGPPARCEVEVTDADGRAVAGRAVRARGTRGVYGDGAWQHAMTDATDDEGVARLGPLVPGDYGFAVDHPESGGSVGAGEARTIEPGETLRVRVELPRSRRRLAASGVVVDENDEPLRGVTVWMQGDPWPEVADSDDDGRFEIWATPRDNVTLRLDVDTEGDVYEPTTTTVPFGTRDLRFVRTATAAPMVFRIRATDAVTGAPIDAVYASFDRGPGTESGTNGYAPREIYRRGVVAGMRVHINAVGYVGRTFDLWGSLADSSDATPTIDVALQPGLRTTVRVRHMDTGVPIAGAKLRNAAGDEFTTGPDGVATIDVAAWSEFTISAEGFTSETWDPESSVLFPGADEYLAAE